LEPIKQVFTARDKNQYSELEFDQERSGNLKSKRTQPS
jgi:hypothetical protein